MFGKKDHSGVYGKFAKFVKKVVKSDSTAKQLLEVIAMYLVHVSIAKGVPIQLSFRDTGHGHYMVLVGKAGEEEAPLPGEEPLDAPEASEDPDDRVVH